MILITGGTGFLGRELIHQLLSDGRKVRVLYRTEDKLSALQPFLKDIETVQGDLLDVASLELAMKGVSEVYHCAGFTGFLRSDYQKLMKVNVEGTANLVNIMLLAGVRRLIYVSSIYAYGALPGKTITEESKWESTRWNTRYGLSKMLAEREVWRGQEEGLQTMIVQPGVILGPDAREDAAINAVIEAVDKGFPFYLPGQKGYVDVRDVAKVMIELMDKEAFGQKFIVVAEHASTKVLLQEVAHALGKVAPSKQLPSWIAPLMALADMLLSFFSGKKRRLALENIRISLQPFTYSNQKLQKTLDFQFIPLKETIGHVVARYQSSKATS
jgi:dihydroflavonol-4-reductase